jgi:hypothetical protein
MLSSGSDEAFVMHDAEQMCQLMRLFAAHRFSCRVQPISESLNDKESWRFAHHP